MSYDQLACLLVVVVILNLRNNSKDMILSEDTTILKSKEKTRQWSFKRLNTGLLLTRLINCWIYSQNNSNVFKWKLIRKYS